MSVENLINELKSVLICDQITDYGEQTDLFLSEINKEKFKEDLPKLLKDRTNTLLENFNCDNLNSIIKRENSIYEIIILLTILKRLDHANILYCMELLYGTFHSLKKDLKGEYKNV